MCVSACVITHLRFGVHACVHGAYHLNELVLDVVELCVGRMQTLQTPRQ